MTGRVGYGPSGGVRQPYTSDVGRKLIWFAAAVAGLALAAPAAATHKPGHPPTDASAYDQYVEQIPAGSGSKTPGRGRAKKRPLPRRAAEELREQGGSDAELLESVATDTRLGAPERKLPSSPSISRKIRKETHEEPTTAGALAAGVDVASDGSENRIVGLLVVLGAVTAALVAAVLLRRRRA